MGESERYIDRRFKKIHLGEDNNALMALIGINGVAFLILGLVQVIYYMIQSPANSFETDVLPWFINACKTFSACKSSLDILSEYVFSYRHYSHFYQYAMAMGFWLHIPGHCG